MQTRLYEGSKYRGSEKGWSKSALGAPKGDEMRKILSVKIAIKNGEV
jgi:hypothetical protein